MMETLRYVDVEVVDDMFEPQYGDHGEIAAYEVSANLPEPFSKVLGYLNDNPDTVTCGLRALTVDAMHLPEPFCTQPVGWVLHEDDDNPHAGGLRWAWTTLVETEGGVLAVCEECSPGNLYDDAMDSLTRSRS